MQNPSLSYLLISSAFQVPHYSKISAGACEDAYFINPDNRTFGIADGVGGWIKYNNANASKWSHDMMYYANLSSSMFDNPKEIANFSYNSIDTSFVGSTTATIVKLVNSTLFIYNIGDSGCAVFRDHRCGFESKRTQNGFNYPYQLGTGQKHTVDDGTLEYVQIELDDTIVCATDGLWDNLYINEIETILQQTWDEKSIPSVFTRMSAKKLVEKALYKAGNAYINTPMSDAAKAAGIDFKGGKLDDTTVIVSRVLEEVSDN